MPEIDISRNEGRTDTHRNYLELNLLSARWSVHALSDEYRLQAGALSSYLKSASRSRASRLTWFIRCCTRFGHFGLARLFRGCCCSG